MKEQQRNPEQMTNEGRHDDVDTPSCPECGHSEIATIWEDRTFPYGVSPQTVEIPVRLPVRKCGKCGFQFFDEEAEDLRHEAVCHHLGVLAPAEIRALREKLGLSRAEFAKLTRLGEATIARWERGELIQNAGNDSLLRLLFHEDNVQRLRSREQNTTLSQHSSVNRIKPKYRNDPRVAAKREDAERFQLCWN